MASFRKIFFCIFGQQFVQQQITVPITESIDSVSLLQFPAVEYYFKKNPNNKTTKNQPNKKSPENKKQTDEPNI